MFIQYHHVRKFPENKTSARSYTVCVELPSKESFVEAIQNENRQIALKVGIAFCSKKDQFVKKKGRELSKARLEEQSFRISNISFLMDEAIFTLTSIDFPSNSTTLKLRTNKKSDKIHLIKAK